MKYTDTVEIGVGIPGPRFQVLAYHTLLKELGEDGLNFKSIADIVLSNPQVVHVTFTESADAEEFLRKHGGVSQHVMEGKPTPMVFRDPNISEKFVRISDFPANGTLEVVTTRLREFGAVLDIRRERYRPSAEYFSCLTGVIVARMSLRTAIPNYLQIGDYKTFVRYPGQPQTCRACNLPGHIGANCPKRTQPAPAAARQMKPVVPTNPQPPPSGTRPTSNFFPSLGTQGARKSTEQVDLDSHTAFPPLGVTPREKKNEHPVREPQTDEPSATAPIINLETPTPPLEEIHVVQIHEEVSESRPLTTLSTSPSSVPPPNMDSLSDQGTQAVTSRPSTPARTGHDGNDLDTIEVDSEGDLSTPSESEGEMDNSPAFRPSGRVARETLKRGSGSPTRRSARSKKKKAEERLREELEAAGKKAADNTSKFKKKST